MRVLIKILLFPITLILTVLILFFDFVCLFSTAVLSILSFVVFMIALGTIFILRETSVELNNFKKTYYFDLFFKDRRSVCLEKNSGRLRW